MGDIEIKEYDFTNKDADEFIVKTFLIYSKKNNIETNYKEFCFVARDNDKIIGVTNGTVLYDEVHVIDLVVDEEYRGKGVGSKLLKCVEDAYSNEKIKIITLTTYEYQAPEFYKKLGYSVEYIRENENQKLKKYFLKKDIKQ